MIRQKAAKEALEKEQEEKEKERQKRILEAKLKMEERYSLPFVAFLFDELVPIYFTFPSFTLPVG